jgi:hypothetical protein
MAEMSAPATPPAKKPSVVVRGLRALLLVFLVLLVLLGVGRVWGAHVCSVLAEQVKTQVAVERAALVAERSPCLRGEPVDENAVPHYRKAFAAFVEPDFAVLNATLNAVTPGQPLPAATTKLLDEHRGEIAEIRAGARCNRSDWEIEWDRGVDAPIPSLTAARICANLTVAEGHERLAAGDVQGAAERYVDVVRLGSDMHGMLIMQMISIAIESIGMNALTSLFEDQPVTPALRAQVAGELAKLEESASTERLVAALRADRLLSLTSYAGMDSRAFVGLDQGSFSALLMRSSGKLFYALTLPGVDEQLRKLEQAVQIADRAERDKALLALNEGAAHSSNLLVHYAIPNLALAGDHQNQLHALIRVLLAALAIEEKRTPDGLYPKEVDLPVDPCGAPAKLHYQPTEGGKGFKVWSVGLNGKDDGGVPQKPGHLKSELGDDLVFERKAPGSK